LGKKNPIGSSVHINTKKVMNVTKVTHGEEEFEQLTPFGEVSSGGSHLKLDVGVDVDSENWMGVGRSGDLGGKSEGGELMGALDHGEGIGDPFEV
jgi:hypothetical protein